MAPQELLKKIIDQASLEAERVHALTLIKQYIVSDDQTSLLKELEEKALKKTISAMKLASS